jgi:hypothetical protein
MELGLDALQIDGVREARELFQRAISGIEVVYGESAQAAKARSLWRAEGSKVFKGEPYERAMAFYYAGLSYLLEREWDNARASFRGAILQDSFAEEDQFRCDSALMYYLFGWTSRQMGNSDDARIGFEQAGRIRPELKAPDADANVLFIIELGRSPRKRTDGIGHAALRFFRGKGFTESTARVRLSSQEVVPVPVAEDVFFQASTRGARRIDQILHDKVVYVEAGVSDLAATTTDLPSTPGRNASPGLRERQSSIPEVLREPRHRSGTGPGSVQRHRQDYRFERQSHCRCEVLVQSSGFGSPGGACASFRQAASLDRVPRRSGQSASRVDPAPGYRCSPRARDDGLVAFAAAVPFCQSPSAGTGSRFARRSSMRPKWSKWTGWLEQASALLLASLLLACSTATYVDNTPGRATSYEPPTQPSRVTGGVGIEGNDIVSMTDQMMRDILANQLFAALASAPRVIVDSAYFVNEGSTPINKNLITDRLRVELSRAAAGRMLFVARESIRAVESEKELKREGVVDSGTPEHFEHLPTTGSPDASTRSTRRRAQGASAV